MRERKQMSQKVNLMTSETHARLEKELERVKEQLREAGQKMGDAFGPDCDWHDNAAADFAVEEYQRIGALEASIKVRLKNAKIIEPRMETEKVGIGNTVVIRLGDFNGDETFTILNPDDSLTGKDRGWISCESPVAQAMLGMRKGEAKEFPLDEKRTQSVIIKEILPGQFNKNVK